MYRFALVILLGFALVSTLPHFDRSWATDGGEAVFNRLGCQSCHKPDRKTAGESLATIAAAYQNEAQLVQFFNGGAPPLLVDQLPASMQSQMGRLAQLSPEDKSALAGFMFQFK